MALGMVRRPQVRRKPGSVLNIASGSRSSGEIPSEQLILYEYDAIYDNWTLVSPNPTALGIQSVSFGASAVVDDRALAFYYGGLMSNATVAGGPQQRGLGDLVAQPGLLQYDMLSNTWRNGTFVDGIPRAEGTMYYIPASDAGMLVYFGGVQQNSNGSFTGVSAIAILLLQSLNTSQLPMDVGKS